MVYPQQTSRHQFLRIIHESSTAVASKAPQEAVVAMKVEMMPELTVVFPPSLSTISVCVVLWKAGPDTGGWLPCARDSDAATVASQRRLRGGDHHVLLADFVHVVNQSCLVSHPDVGEC